MATAIYVYTNKKDYDKIYRGKNDAWTYQTPILDFFIKPTEGYEVEDSILSNRLWVITNTTKIKERPDTSRTIVHFTNGTAFDYLRGDELLVEKEKLSYNPKNNQLEFYPRRFRQPLMSLRVDKVVGGKPNGKKIIDFKHKYYDIAHNRINLFV